MNTKLLIRLVIGYIALSAIYAYILLFVMGDQEKAGQFGDMFGAVTSIVNGIALIVLAYTLFYQSSSHVINSLEVFYSRWNNPTMLTMRLNSAKKYFDDEIEYFTYELQEICAYFEYLGLVTKAQAIDTNLIWDLYSHDIEHYWGVSREYIIDARNTNSDDTFFVNFEELYEDMRRIARKKNAPFNNKTTTDFNKYMAAELSVTKRILAK